MPNSQYKLLSQTEEQDQIKVLFFFLFSKSVFFFILVGLQTSGKTVSDFCLESCLLKHDSNLHKTIHDMGMKG